MVHGVSYTNSSPSDANCRPQRSLPLHSFTSLCSGTTSCARRPTSALYSLRLSMAMSSPRSMPAQSTMSSTQACCSRTSPSMCCKAREVDATLVASHVVITTGDGVDAGVCFDLLVYVTAWKTSCFGAASVQFSRFVTRVVNITTAAYGRLISIKLWRVRGGCSCTAQQLR